MKTVTKTFYVDQEFFQALRDNNCFFEIPNAVFDINSISGGRKKIEISYEEPEKKIEITESEFDDAFYHAQYEALATNSWQKTGKILKQKLFGNNVG